MHSLPGAKVAPGGSGIFARHEGRAGLGSALLAADEQQAGADDDGADAGPQRDVDALFLLDRELDRAEVGLVLLLGVAEAAVDEAENAEDDEDDADQLDCAHLPLPSLTMESRVAACSASLDASP